MNDLQKYWNSDEERCGFILKSGEIVEVPNIAPNPQHEFEVSEEDFEKYYSEVAASWHTHTNDFSNLSLSDYYTFQGLPEWDHWVVSKYKMVKFILKSGCVIIDSVVNYGDS